MHLDKTSTVRRPAGTPEPCGSWPRCFRSGSFRAGPRAYNQSARGLSRRVHGPLVGGPDAPTGFDSAGYFVQANAFHFKRDVRQQMNHRPEETSRPWVLSGQSRFYDGGKTRIPHRPTTACTSWPANRDGCPFAGGEHSLAGGPPIQGRPSNRPSNGGASVRAPTAPFGGYQGNSGVGRQENGVAGFSPVQPRSSRWLPGGVAKEGAGSGPKSAEIAAWCPPARLRGGL